MQPPDVRNTVRQRATNVTYHIMAYRRLTRSEMLEQIAVLHAQPKIRRLKKPIRNKTFEIITIIGATDPL